MVSKGRSKTDSTSLATAATQSSDRSARPVTRSEFQELVRSISLLQKQVETQTRLDIQVSSELEVFSAQIALNKSTLAKLAEQVLEKTEKAHEAVTKKIQKLEVECDRRLTDLQLMFERLEFRFKHHIRDCNSVAEQVDLQHEALNSCKSQVAQVQLSLDKQSEQQQALADTIDYATKNAESRTRAVEKDYAKSLESFQRRMLSHMKGVEESSHEAIAVIAAHTRDIELQGKRYKALLHQHLEEQLKMQQSLSEFEARQSRMDLDQEECRRVRVDDMERIEALEGRLGNLLMLLERTVERDVVEELVERSVCNVKTRIDAMLEVRIVRLLLREKLPRMTTLKLLQLCVQTATR